MRLMTALVAACLVVGCTDEGATAPPPDAQSDGTETTDGAEGTDGSDETDGTDGASPALRGYHVGNSLTLDTAPGWQAEVLEQNGFTVENAWHIQCGQPLVAIQTSPSTCFDSPEPYGQWTNALSGEFTWDYVTVQPFPGEGSTLSTDLAAIAAFLENLDDNPPQVFLYAAWTPNRETFMDTWGTNAPVAGDDPATALRPAWFDALWTALDAVYGERLRLIPVGEVFYQLGLKANAGEIEGLGSQAALFRDNVHASVVGQAAAALTTATVLAGRTLTADAAIFQSDQGSVDQALIDVILTTIEAVVTADPRTGVQ